jgi:Holliday junction resolvase RusA-like endonuclease
MIRMVIPIIPAAQMRARAAVRNGHAIAYKAAKQRHAEDSLIALMRQYRPVEPISGPVMLLVTAYMPIPQSWSKKRRLEAVEGTVYHDKRPDVDNLLKQVADCMTQLSFWNDDTQVAEVTAKKVYSVNPGWEIILEAL